MSKFIIAVLLLMSFFIAACNQTSAETDEMKQIIEDELGVSPYIPEGDSVCTMVLNYSPVLADDGESEKGGSFKVEIEYKASTDEKVDEEMKEVWEERDPLREIIYGDLYMDPNTSKVTIFPDGAGEITDAEHLEIEGHEVQYQHIDRESGTVIMAMDFADYSYMIEYYLIEGKTEEDAKAFAKDIIRNVEQ
ncbi:hypothetical protein ACDX78_17870 [Virgibacillus oceani]